VTPAVIVDDAVTDAERIELRDAITRSKLLGDSPLGGTFLATRGFSITFHRDARVDVEARFPFLARFLQLALDEHPAREVQRRPLLGGPPLPNAFYLNVLVVPPGAGVGLHVDATLGPPNRSVIPEAVSVLYLDVPPDLRGGLLKLCLGEHEIDAIEPRDARYVVFAGRLGHEVTTVEASRPRMSIVCEQYALAPGVLSAVPRLKVHARNAFQNVLDDVKARHG
jgi:hypothetical protein